MKLRLEKAKTIYCEIEKQNKTEKQKWRHIVKYIVEDVLFCAENGLALPGHDNEGGNFLNVIKLLSHYDEVLAEHLFSDRHAK